jgi:hypothetical protein
MSYTFAPICSKVDVETYLCLSSPTAADDALIEMFRGFVENDMRGFCRHNITQPSQGYIHYLPDRKLSVVSDKIIGIEIYGGRGVPQILVENGDALQLPQAFVRSITGVWVNYFAYGGQAPDPFPDTTKLTQGIDFWMDDDYDGMCRSGILYRLASWAAYPRGVKVEYMAGFTQEELSNTGRFSFIRFAAIEETAHQFKLAKERMGPLSDGVGRVQQQVIGKESSITYDPKSLCMAPLSETCKMRLEPIMSLFQ